MANTKASLPESVARRAAARGIRIDVRTAPRTTQPDALGPSGLSCHPRLGWASPFQFQAWVRAESETEAQYTLFRGEEVLARGPVQLPSRPHPFALPRPWSSSRHGSVSLADRCCRRPRAGKQHRDRRDSSQRQPPPYWSSIVPVKPGDWSTPPALCWPRRRSAQCRTSCRPTSDLARELPRFHS